MLDISKYYMLLIPIFIGGLLWIIKFIVFYVKHGFDWAYTLEHGTTYGHMPSAHTGFMASLITSVGYYEGVASGAFTVAAALAIIVIDDALRLRIYMGDQGRRLNFLTQQLHMDKKEFPRLKERVGHRKNEVAVGVVLGFILTLAVIMILK